MLEIRSLQHLTRSNGRPVPFQSVCHSAVSLGITLIGNNSLGIGRVLGSLGVQKKGVCSVGSTNQAVGPHYWNVDVLR